MRWLHWQGLCVTAGATLHLLPGIMQGWVSIDFARDIILECRIGSGSFGQVRRTRNSAASCTPRAASGADALWGRPRRVTPPVAGVQVYAARWNGSWVAVKLVPLLPGGLGEEPGSGSSSSSLRQEVAVLSRLQHPNIIRSAPALLGSSHGR
jgi:hypothetical protein